MVDNKKERRRQIRLQLKKEENEKLVSSLPMSLELLKEFFNYLDVELTAYGCEHKFNFVTKFIMERGLDYDKTLHWLNENGAWCDCEVLGNVEEKYEEIIL